MALGVRRSTPIEMRVRGRFLVRSDVRGFPAEKEIKRLVDDVGEKGRIDDIVPQRGGGEDSFATKNKVHEGGSIISMSRTV